MKYLILLAFMGCASYSRNIVHDYVIRHAINTCKNHGQLHYIATESSVRNDDRKTCKVKYVVSCQDEFKDLFYDGTIYCGVREAQLDESLKESK